MGYPIVLALVYRVLGVSNVAVEALNLAFAIAAGGLLLHMTRRILGPRPAVVALLLYALWPAGALMIVHVALDLVRFRTGAWR